MITLLVGENDFEKRRELGRLVAQFDGTAEKYDGASLEISGLPDLLSGTTLFSDKRLIIVSGLSENKLVWEKFAELADKKSEDSEIILVETKPDKRTAAFKGISKIARVVESNAWGDRDTGAAVAWLKKEADLLGFKLENAGAQMLVARVGMNQWELFHALEKLALAGSSDLATIEDLIDSSPVESVFNLFDAALSGDSAKVRQMISVLATTEDPYRLFALLSSQAFQLAAVALAGEGDNPSKDFGIHPFVAGKLKKYSQSMSRSEVARVVTIFAKADDQMKSSKAEPWVLIENSLLKLCN